MDKREVDREVDKDVMPGKAERQFSCNGHLATDCLVVAGSRCGVRSHVVRRHMSHKASVGEDIAPFAEFLGVLAVVQSGSHAS